LKTKIIIAILAVFVLSSVGFGNYIDPSIPTFISPNQTMDIDGYFRMSNNSGYAGVNFSVNGTGMTGDTNSSGTVANGYFQLNVTTPMETGEHNITFVTNESVQKNISYFVTNISYGKITFISKKPPFNPGNTFLINVTLLDKDNSSIASYNPLIEVFAANGPPGTGWSITNKTNADTHATGNITYNLTVPAGADGNYVIAIDRGIIHTMFVVSSGNKIAVITQTDSNETRSNYAPGGNFTIIAKMRNSDGDPIGYADNVTAFITYPNGTVTNITLNNDTTREGYYTSNNFVTDSNLNGSYTITVEANVGSTEVEGGTVVKTNYLKSSLQRQQGFFIEWGDASAFPVSSMASLNVIVTNLSNGYEFAGTIDSAAVKDKVHCNLTNDTLKIYFPNGTLVNSDQILDVDVDAGGTYFSKSVCRIKFTTFNTTGYYKLTYNTTVETGGKNVTAEGVGYAQVERFALKPSAVSSFGGAEFMTMLYPGSNATFEIGAYDMSANQEVPGINITSIVVNKIIPLEFFSGSTDIYEGDANDPNYFVVTDRSDENGTTYRNPKITIQIPVNRTGPFQVEITVEINAAAGRFNVTGKGFYMAKYIMGFVSSMGGMSGMGGGPAGGFGGGSACEGTQQFSGSVMDIESNSAPKDKVQFVNILEARDEITGRDISSCLTMQKNSSDTNGLVGIPITFDTSSSGCTSMSGFYFMLINVSYQGKPDAIPSGFMCQQLSFWVNSYDAVTGNSMWRVSPDAKLNFSVSNIRNLQNSSLVIENGTFELVRAMNFHPSTGPKALTITSDTVAVNLSGGSANITLSPGNLSLSEWPNGFVDLTWRVTANNSDDSAGKTDTSWGGFQSSPFDAWIESVTYAGDANPSSGWDKAVSAGQNITVVIDVGTNVSRANCRGGDLSCGDKIEGTGTAKWENISTTTGFTVKIGLPWEGKLKTLSVTNANLTLDQWNTSADWGTETWNLSLTLPSTLKKGQTMITVTVNNSEGRTTDSDIWLRVETYTIQIGSEEAMNMENGYYYLQWNSTGGVDGTGDAAASIVAKGFNLTNINSTNDTMSKSGMVCVRRGLNVTRYTDGSTSYTIRTDNEGQNISILVLDNATAGVYDTVIIKNGTDPSALYNATYILHAGDALPSAPEIYLWKIEDCGYVRWINSSYTPQNNYGSWAGQYSKGTQFTVPYIIRKAGSVLSGVTVSVNSIIKQNDNFGTGGGTGGFGFDKKLETGDFSSGEVNTDSNGVAFVPVNISISGSMMMFWRINESGGAEDYASFKTMMGSGGSMSGGMAGGDMGTQVQIRSFQTWSNKLNQIGSGTATVVLNMSNLTATENPTTIYGLTFAQTKTMYNVTVNESESNIHYTEGDGLYRLIYNITDSNYISSNYTSTSVNSTTLTTPGSAGSHAFSVSGRTLGIADKRQDGDNLLVAVYDQSDAGWSSIYNATQNLSVRLCAQTFTRPYSAVESATVYIYAESWNYMNPTASRKAMYWFDPINQSRYSFETKNVTVGPGGCTALDIVPVDGWTAGTSTNVQAVVKSGSDSESTWVDSVWMPVQCSNGMDDDGDGYIDYRPWDTDNQDPQCSNWDDNSESS